MSRRSYDSSGRRTAAARTQQRVLEAATRLMSDRGYAGTTVADVAEAAGVSVPLVYAAFGNKAGLLKRIVDVAIVGDTEPVALRERPAVAAIKAASSARARCDLNAQLIASVHERTADLAAVLRDAAGTDPEVAALGERLEAGRRDGMAEFVSVLAAAGHLRTGMDPGKAADLVWVLTDPLIYQRLVVQRGWSTGEYENWLGSAMYDAVGR
jgi:AcrR family transcriptional regulator